MKRILKEYIKKLGYHFGRRFPTEWVSLLYFLRFKKRLNLKNPKTLNEKILYLSLKTDTSFWTELSDKYKVRDYIKNTIGENHLINLIKVTDDVDKLDLSTLPSKFVIKTNHGSGDIIIVRNKKDLNLKELKQTLKNNLKPYFGHGGEKHYEKIKPLILFEELIENDEESNSFSSSIIDYKCWCFNGKCYYIFVFTNRNRYKSDILLYDTEWKPLYKYCIFNDHYCEGKEIPKPQNLKELIKIAEKLAKPFPCVRVDLYDIKNKILFGEMTFTSLGGLMNCFTPEFQNMAGSLIDLNYKPSKNFDKK